MKNFLVAVLCFCTVFSFAACGKNDTEPPIKQTKEFFSMGTSISLTAYGENAENAVTQGETIMKELNGLWSTCDSDSELSRLNRAEGQPMQVSQVTADLLSFTLGISEKTNGRLDPTVNPLMNVWGFTDNNFRMPTEEELNAAKSLVGYDKVQISENTVTMLPNMQLDFGAVAKGYACDMIIDTWKAQGIQSGIANLGGNIGVIGKNEDGEDWKISVQNPNDNSSLGILHVSDCSVVTSGSYIRYFEDEQGNIYGHIMNPATGYPVTGDLKSVTIVGKESKVCDALATAFFVMGYDEAVAYWRQYGEFEALFVKTDDTVHITNGLESIFDKADAVTQVNVLR